MRHSLVVALLAPVVPSAYAMDADIVPDLLPVIGKAQLEVMTGEKTLSHDLVGACDGVLGVREMVEEGFPAKSLAGP